MSIALGRNPEEELKTNLHKISQHLSDQCGLLFTNKSSDEVKQYVLILITVFDQFNINFLIRYFKDYSKSDYARSGSQAQAQIDLPEGPLSNHVLSTDDVSQSFPPSSLHSLHQLGLKDAFLNKGVIELRRPYTICKQGEILSPEQCRLLVSIYYYYYIIIFIISNLLLI